MRRPNAGFHHYLVGNPGDVVRSTSGLLVPQGGGDDVDANYVRMGEAAGGGDFVVLRASGDDDYNEYIFGLCHCDSVETIVFESREAAFDPGVVETIRNAEAIFIGGGDQSNYVRYWKGTPVEDAINFVAAKPAPIGGTSAGMAIMGEFSYSAMSPESLTSEVALADPYAADVTLERDFLVLPGLQGVLTDQHLWERDRIGRTVALMARLVQDGWTTTGAGDRGRSRDRGAHRPSHGNGAGLRDRRPPDAIRLFHAHHAPLQSVASLVSRSPSTMSRSIGWRPAGASTSPRGGVTAVSPTRSASTMADCIRLAAARTE